MKNVIIGILLVATVTFGGLWRRQIHKASQAQTSAEALQQNVTELRATLEQRDKKAERLREQLEDTRADAAARIHETAQFNETLQATLAQQGQRAPASASSSTNSKPSNALAQMFKNPEMKEMIKAQQKSALGAMIDKNYGRLFSDLHLTAEQTSALKDMILNKQMAAADMGLSMFADDLDAAKRAELVQQVKTASDAGDAQIKEFLGGDNFTQYQAYERSLNERMAVSGFRDQLGTGPTALTGDQEQQLLQAMTQERQNFKFTVDLSDQSKFGGDFGSMLTEDRVNAFVQELGRLNQQYLAKAQGILSPEQFAAYEKYLDNQQALQKAGMQMAAKMFAPAKAGGESP